MGGGACHQSCLHLTVGTVPEQVSWVPHLQNLLRGGPLLHIHCEQPLDDLLCVGGHLGPGRCFEVDLRLRVQQGVMFCTAQAPLPLPQPRAVAGPPF